MRKILLLCVAVFAFGGELSEREKNEIALYEQILSNLKAEQIPQFIVGIVAGRLPYKIDEHTILSSLEASGVTLVGRFKLTDAPGRKISKFNAAQLEGLKREFIANGVGAICKNSAGAAILNKGVRLRGVYELGGRRAFEINADKSSCE